MLNINIKYDYTILHLDEYPILFIGKNYKYEAIIGSFLFEDSEENTIKYFHSVIGLSLAKKFLKREISYLEVLKEASSINIVTKNYNNEILNTQEQFFSLIDKSWLPLPTALCPKVDNKIILKFEGLTEPDSAISPNVIAPNFTKTSKISSRL
jgi:hypothetical protein